MAQLVSMEMSKEEIKEWTKPSPDDAPKYPWGLCISLDDGTLEKLGVDTLPQVGSDVMVMARAKVTSVSSNQREGGDDERNVSLQITEMQLADAPAQGKDGAANVLYPTMKQGKQ